MATLLIVTVALPFAGALLLAAWGPGVSTSRMLSLVVTVITALLSVYLLAAFDPASEPFAAVDRDWLGDVSGVNVRLSLGLDGLSLWMFGLSAILMVTAVLVSWEAIQQRASLFYAMLLLLETGCLGVFAARDIILFYIFFEFTLIPLFFLIGIWGSEQRRYAAVKFFLFTLAGSLFTFLGLLAIVLWDYYGQSGTPTLQFSIPALTASLGDHPIQPVSLQVLIFIALFAGFAIKVPLFPLHTWLPLAHVQAPTAGSVFLAGILLKIGTYGFLRFSLPMLPDAAALCMPWLLWLSVIGIIYGALVALAQADMKRLIAYSSVSHLGFVMLGMFSLNRLGTAGATLQMVNHGISTGALFALVGMLYERYHTREIRQLGGLAKKLPVMAFFMVLFTLSSIGVPGLNGFAGEILILLGMFQRGFLQGPDVLNATLRPVAVVSVFGVVLGAWYMLYLVQRVFFGPVREPPHAEESEPTPMGDLKLREIMALAPLGVLAVWIGIAPGFFVEKMQPALGRVTEAAAESVEQIYNTPAPVVAEAPTYALETRLASKRIEPR